MAQGVLGRVAPLRDHVLDNQLPSTTHLYFLYFYFGLCASPMAGAFTGLATP